MVCNFGYWGAPAESRPSKMSRYGRAPRPAQHMLGHGSSRVAVCVNWCIRSRTSSCTHHVEQYEITVITATAVFVCWQC
eukprot:6475066-Amphidinium_carterae.5